jgi:hypothetical protein
MGAHVDLSKLNQNQKIAGGAGALLIVNLFLPWYSASFGGFGISINAFNAQFWAWGGSFLAIAGAALIVLKALDIQDISAGETSADALGLYLGIAGFAFVLLRLLTQTSGASIGLFLGILATGAVAYGAFANAKDAGVEMPDIPGVGGGDE